MADGSDTTTQELLAVLDFYRRAGVDTVLSNDPVNRFEGSGVGSDTGPGMPREDGGDADPSQGLQDRQEETPADLFAPAQQGAPAMGSEALPEGDGDAVMAAREMAAQADSLDALKALLSEFEGCPLKATATNLVFADGNPDGRVMFVGEAPGRDEDLQGLPFVGRSGQLLDRMLAAIGLDRGQVYIANTVPWRPPGNRTPTPQETEICRPFIERQIHLADPDFLIPLGSPAAKMLFRTHQGITRIRGTWRDYQTGGRTIRAMASLHPAYLLRQPLQKRLAWRDFLSLKIALDEPPT